MRAAWLALLLLAAPTAAALDMFPTESRLGATEARFLVRLPEGGTLSVRADGPVEVSAANAPFVPAPASFPVSTSSVWHGLPGTVELVARRADPARPVSLDVDDGAGGVALEWPAQPPPRWTPLPGVLALCGAGVVATILVQAWRPPGSRRPGKP